MAQQEELVALREQNDQLRVQLTALGTELAHLQKRISAAAHAIPPSRKAASQR